MAESWRVKAGGLLPVASVAALETLLLTQRMSDIDKQAFFDLSYDRDIHDPYDFLGMESVVERIYRAVRDKERIIIYGDYDVDGISSTAILLSVLEQLGARVSPYIPHRVDDGYGLRQHVVDRLQGEMDLLITVDCGITSVAEVSHLASAGVDTIIIDHHTPPALLPPAHAIIHPRHPDGAYPYPWLCGAGVTWKVACALLRDSRSPVHHDPDTEKWLLDLAALGTIADMVPLLGENRAIASFGLQVLKRSRRPGLQALVQSIEAGTFSETTLAFRVIPLLNAAGRMDHAQPALELLVASDPARARELLRELTTLNQQRQSATRRVLKEVEAKLLDPAEPFVFATGADWPTGVVGLVAGRLARAWNKPAIIVGGGGVGSARSPEGINILDFLQSGAAHLTHLGGHAQAAGFTVKMDNIQEFLASLQNQARGLTPRPKAVSIDAILEPHLLSWPTVELLERFAPFGIGNERPCFAVKNVPLVSLRAVGKKEEHSKFSFRINDELFDGIGFGLAEQTRETLGPGMLVDVAGEIEKNVFRGRARLQLSVQAVAPAGSISIAHDETPLRNAVH